MGSGEVEAMEGEEEEGLGLVEEEEGDLVALEGHP